MQPFLRVESDNFHVTKNSRKFGSKRALSHRRLDATLKAPSELSPRWGGGASPNSGDRPDGRCSAHPKPKSAAQQIADGREMPTVLVLPPPWGDIRLRLPIWPDRFSHSGNIASRCRTSVLAPTRANKVHHVSHVLIRQARGEAWHRKLRRRTLGSRCARTVQDDRDQRDRLSRLDDASARYSVSRPE